MARYPQPSSLFFTKLPPEIRLYIYRYYLAVESVYFRPARRLGMISGLPAALARTCKLAYREMRCEMEQDVAIQYTGFAEELHIEGLRPTLGRRGRLRFSYKRYTYDAAAQGRIRWSRVRRLYIFGWAYPYWESTDNSCLVCKLIENPGRINPRRVLDAIQHWARLLSVNIAERFRRRWDTPVTFGELRWPDAVMLDYAQPSLLVSGDGNAQGQATGPDQLYDFVLTRCPKKYAQRRPPPSPMWQLMQNSLLIDPGMRWLGGGYF